MPKKCQEQCGTWDAAALLVHQFVGALTPKMKGIRKSTQEDLHQSPELFRQHCAAMRRGSVCGNARIMIQPQW
jgi:hypothetical protein